MGAPKVFCVEHFSASQIFMYRKHARTNRSEREHDILKNTECGRSIGPWHDDADDVKMNRADD